MLFKSIHSYKEMLNVWFQHFNMYFYMNKWKKEYLRNISIFGKAFSTIFSFQDKYGKWQHNVYYYRLKINETSLEQENVLSGKVVAKWNEAKEKQKICELVVQLQ